MPPLKREMCSKCGKNVPATAKGVPYGTHDRRVTSLDPNDPDVRWIETEPCPGSTRATIQQTRRQNDAEKRKG